MADTKGRVFTGARARLSINNEKVGYARNCSGGEVITQEEVEALDNIEVEEHAPTRYRVSFSMGTVRLVGESMKTKGIFPKTGANPTDHLKNIINQQDLTVTIEDNQTGAILYTILGVKATTNNFNVDAGGISGVDNQFVAVRMLDESEV